MKAGAPGEPRGRGTRQKVFQEHKQGRRKAMPVTAGRRTFLLPASPSLHPRTATAGPLLGNHKQRQLAHNSLGIPAAPQPARRASPAPCPHRPAPHRGAEETAEQAAHGTIWSMKAYPGAPQASGVGLSTLNPMKPLLQAGPSIHLPPGLPAAFRFFSRSAAREDLNSNQVLSVSCLEASPISHQTCNKT